MVVSMSQTIELPEDITKILGLSLTASFRSEQLMASYNRAMFCQKHSATDIRLAYKLARDPFYRKAFVHYGSFGTVEDAGFFDDGLAPGVMETLSSPQIITTSLVKVRNGVKASSEEAPENPHLLVLLTTGAFAPVHEGHLEIMEAARITMQSQGYRVVGGFFAPAHDYYVSQKNDGAHLWTGERRLKALTKVLETSDWLDVDPWMCRHMPTDLMFTDVILRMNSYLATNIKSINPIKVGYVFGGDHADHARCFVKHGIGICVNNRLGFDIGVAAVESEFTNNLSSRVYFSKINQKNISSSDIRLGKKPLLKALSDDPELNDFTPGSHVRRACTADQELIMK